MEVYIRLSHQTPPFNASCQTELQMHWPILLLDGSNILLDFSLSVKAATLIFISGCDSAISSTKEGKSVQFLFIVW